MVQIQCELLTITTGFIFLILNFHSNYNQTD